ncbi:MAG: 4-hydroxy-tetrahydrodipicolinate reductase [Pseudomonadota bacterium]
MTKFAVLGHKGRMGQALAQAIEEAGHEFCVGVDLGGDPAPVIGQCEVAVDFSSPDGLIQNLAAAKATGIPILIGTTGLETEHFDAIEDAAQSIPVIQTGNTSLGVTLLAALVREAAAKLGIDWDIEVLEMHHRGKVDAPSGTAKLLGEAAAQGRGVDLASLREAGRDGLTGARREGAIGFSSLRGGTVNGEHSVIFAGPEERLTLSHSAENRMVFARGAVRGATWLIGRAAGRYTMDDVLELG